MKAIYFYGHGDNEEYNYMSNFYKCLFVDRTGVQYMCSEQYLMKKKQEMFDFDNEHLADAIMSSDNPAMIKAFGRKVGYFDEDTWNKRKYQVMCDALYLKFTQNDDIRMKLIQTGNVLIAEASPTDKVWGIGMSKDEASGSTQNQWRGTNLLGFALIRVREQITPHI